jgi:hypothetical protein
MSKYWLPPTDRKDIYQFALDISLREFADLWESWKQLEAKAQATLATAGIFEAGAFAYITQAKLGESWLIKAMLVGLAVVLAYSVCEGVRSILVKGVDTAFGGRQLYEDIWGSVKNADPSQPLSDTHEGWIVTFTNLTADSNEKIRQTLDIKAARLKRSQWALVIAALLIVPLIVYTLYSAAPSSDGIRS